MNPDKVQRARGFRGLVGLLILLGVALGSARAIDGYAMIFAVNFGAGMVLSALGFKVWETHLIWNEGSE